MKIGVSAFAWTTQFGPLHLGIMPRLKEHGVDGFEIPIFEPAKLDTREIRQTAEANELECTVCAILPQNLSPISNERAIRRQAHEHLLRCIETTRDMGARLLGGRSSRLLDFYRGDGGTLTTTC